MMLVFCPGNADEEETVAHEGHLRRHFVSFSSLRWALSFLLPCILVTLASAEPKPKAKPQDVGKCESRCLCVDAV